MLWLSFGVIFLSTHTVPGILNPVEAIATPYISRAFGLGETSLMGWTWTRDFIGRWHEWLPFAVFALNLAFMIALGIRGWRAPDRDSRNIFMPGMVFFIPLTCVAIAAHFLIKLRGRRQENAFLAVSAILVCSYVLSVLLRLALKTRRKRKAQAEAEAEAEA